MIRPRQEERAPGWLEWRSGVLRLGPDDAAPLPDCDPTQPNARSLRPFGPFFANVISGWTPAYDQLTEEKLKNSDLQVAKASGSSSTAFEMGHKMGLLVVNMPSQTVYLTKYWQYNSSQSKWVLNATKNSNAANSTTASGATDFSGSTWKPWASTTTSTFLIGKPGAGALPVSANRGTSDSHYSWDVTDMAITAAGSYVSKTLTPGEVYLKQAWEFSYEGTGRAFTIPAAGTYCFECWGASGGNADPDKETGQGGYTKGEIHLDSAIELVVFVGQQGSESSLTQRFNGGGAGVASQNSSGLNGCSGGGATDIRTKEGLTPSQASAWTTTWSNAYGLRGRIMVAAGGGGNNGNSSYYGYAGGLQGGASSNSSGTVGGLKGCSGATQTSGGLTTSGRVGSHSGAYTRGNNGSFGLGGASASSYRINCGGAGGGGYYGGASGGNGEQGVGGVVGSGGSSYISGHRGCTAIAGGDSNTAKTGTANSVEIATHYSGLYFSDTKMIDGSGYIWTTSRGAQVYVPQTDFYETTNLETNNHGHIGNGFARITQISVD